MKDIHEYDDIIALPHPESASHPRMSLLERAAQFSPFAALSGYDDAVKETARLTDEKTVLSEEELEQLNQKFALLMPHIKERPEVTLTRFVADEKKSGGRYLTETVRIRRLDLIHRLLITVAGQKISLDDIADLQIESRKTEPFE